jgi:UDP-2,3-diacylglucosamine hydrolase
MTRDTHPAVAKLALIAGGGALPVEVANYLKDSGRGYSVIRLKGLADDALATHPGHEVEIGNFAHLFAVLAEDACRSVCMLGYVTRPDFSELKRDAGGAVHLPGIEAAGRGGDDSLLRQVARVFESQGYVIEGAHQACPDLLIGAGLQAGPSPDEAARDDIEEAFRVARAIGHLDIGQAVAVAGKITLAVEAQEGTQAMLERILTLPASVRGRPELRKGVLCKLAKPIQDLRLDMPVIGVSTVEDVARAGLAGIVAQTGALLVADKPGVYQRAAELGIFIYGHEAGTDAAPHTGH